MNCRHCQGECQKYGTDRNQKQRWRCTVCLKTQLEGVIGAFGPRQLPERQRARIRRLRESGATFRQIRQLLGHDHHTITNAVGRRYDYVPVEPVNQPGICDYCRKKIPKNKEADRRTRRTKHRFCSAECYQNFRCGQRSNDRCKRCGVFRYKISCPLFTRGYCNRCYGLLLKFHFDEGLADAHDARLLLKEELHGTLRRTRRHRKVL